MSGGKLIIIKICGITSIEAAIQVKESGADLMGFVFAPSRRQISPENARDISRSISGIGKVGVFVNSPLVLVRAIAEHCRLDFVQLHGDEPPEYCREVGLPIIKAFRVGKGLSAEDVNRFDVSYVLCDSFVPGTMGGSGVVFDWHKTKTSLAQINAPVLIAGGLNVDNVRQAVDILKPSGVDVSGGVERDGIKDFVKIKQFVEAVRTVEEEIC